MDRKTRVMRRAVLSGICVIILLLVTACPLEEDGECSKLSMAGEWRVTWDWDCDGSTGSGTWYLTYGAGIRVGDKWVGTWDTDGDVITMAYEGETHTVYFVGGVSSDCRRISGSMSAVGGHYTGCWSAFKRGE